MYVRDCTPVSPYALMLFGGALEAQLNRTVQQLPGRKGAKARPLVNTECSLTVDGWIKFQTDQNIQILLLQVNALLSLLSCMKSNLPVHLWKGHRLACYNRGRIAPCPSGVDDRALYILLSAYPWRYHIFGLCTSLIN